ncbi:hypothetical protein L7F22_047275 [Adiantum nelumboides]|nr:hypothetical protein [Adiantum nelumboides]
MEAPLKERGMVESASDNSENEMEGEEEKYLAEQHGERRSLPTLVSKESDSGSDDLDTEEKLLSNKEYSATVSSNRDRKQALNDVERITDTDKSTMSDAEIDDDQTGDDEDSSEVFSTDNVYQGRLGKERECEEFGKANPPIPDSASESVELEGQLSGNNDISFSQESCQSNENSSVESFTAPVPKVNKSSSSQAKGGRDIGPDSLEDDGHGTEELPKSEEEYVKKGFSCRGNADEADEELREYWTRALQTSTSTGEMVEEIVKVLKHHQKTHDLLCPVCGSCVTRRVILRKRKRSSYISVDRWYRDPLDEGEVQEQGALPEGAGVEVEERDTQDIEAFGCLSCFSLFFDKGRQLLNQLQEIGPDNFNCLPFFFPPYPWGMTQMKFRSTE